MPSWYIAHTVQQMATSPGTKEQPIAQSVQCAAFHQDSQRLAFCVFFGFFFSLYDVPSVIYLEALLPL